VGAGHVHRPSALRAHDSWIFDGGSDYAFTEIEFDSESVLRHRHWSLQDQKAFSQEALSGPRQKIARKAGKIVRTVDKTNAAVVRGPLTFQSLPGIDASLAKKLLVGFHLAHSLEKWAKDVLPSDLAPHRPPLAIYNQLSYSWEERLDPLFKKQITLGMLKDAIAFPGALRLVVLPGAEVDRLYWGMREYGKLSEIPFRTPILSGPYKEGSNGLLELVGGRWCRLSPRALYPVAMDHWTGSNGYKVAAVEQALTKAAWEKLPREQNMDVIPRYFHAGLPGDTCRRELIRQGSVQR